MQCKIGNVVRLFRMKTEIHESTADCRIRNTVRCPVCREHIRYDTGNPYRPFCSERCRMVDLGQWLAEDYRVVGEPAAREKTDDE